MAIDSLKHVKPVSPALGPDNNAVMLVRAGAIGCFLVSLISYLMTMAPSATFWDAGEFIASAYTLGVPHSPGTPLYVIIGRVATLLPLPLSIAGRVNFISVVAAAGGVVMLYLLVIRFLDMMLGRGQNLGDAIVRVGGALTGALFVTFSTTYWTNAVESEVYALSTFIMGVTTWLGLRWADDPTRLRATAAIYLLFYLMALSVGLHLGTILAFSGVFFLVLLTPKKTFSNAEFLLACFGVAIFMADATLYRKGEATVALVVIFLLVLAFVYATRKSVFAAVCTGLFALGISVHLYLYIRSGHNPLIDEANPETWRNLYAVLRREQYPTSNIFERKASIGFQLQHFNAYFQAQFSMWSGYIGKMNLGSLIPVALGVWGAVDQYAKHRRTFIMLFVTLLVMSLGMIIYLNFSDHEVRERDYFYLPAFYYFAIFIGIGAGSVLSELRRLFSEKSAMLVLPAALLVALPFFTAKHHWFEHDRSNDYTTAAYARNMLVGLEPNAVIFTNGDNDTFPLWYIQEVEGYRTDVRVVNLSLLNTGWYITQLRDNEPKLSIRWTDDQIARLRPYLLEDNSVVLVRDIGVQHILRYVASERPTYFAVTIPPEVFEPYRDIIEMQGLAYRVVPRKGSNMMNEELMELNLWERFDYSGILDENMQRDTSIFQPSYVDRLVSNYAAGFVQLGFLKAQEGDYAEALKNLDAGRAINPDMNAVIHWYGWYLFENGDTTGGIEYYVNEIQKRPRRIDLHYRLAGIYERVGDYESAVRVLDDAIRRDPDYKDAVMSIVPMLTQIGRPEEALGYLERWVRRHPDDAQARAFRDDFAGRLRDAQNAPPGSPSGE